MVAILKPIAVALTQIEGNSCSIGDAVHLWKDLKNSLQPVLNSAQRKLFKKRYEQALTASHFLGYLLTLKYFEEAKNSLTPSEKEKVFDFLKDKHGDIGVGLIAKIIQYELETAPFTGTLMEPAIRQSLTAVQWWKSIQEMKKIFTPEEELIIMQHLTAVASSAPTERVFSTFGLVHSKLRNRLGVEKASKLVFLYKHLNS